MKREIRPGIRVTNKFLLRGNSACALFSHRVTVKAWDPEMGGVLPVLAQTLPEVEVIGNWVSEGC